MGHILLAGGAEFAGRMAELDQCAYALAGGYDSPLVIIPAAAAPDNNHQRAGANGVRWFTALGGRDVRVLPVIDPASAANPENVHTLLEARFIYLLGGFPRHLCHTLHTSPAWAACLRAYQHGAVIAGSSAGAMVLCEYFYDPHTGEVKKGLNLLPNICILPHHNKSGKRWVQSLRELIPDVRLLGLDETTGIIDNRFSDGAERVWRVYGPGAVTRYQASEIRVYRRGETFKLD